MLIEVRSMLRVEDTPVPLSFMPDGTHLSNLAVDNIQWPVSMTIGNLSWKIRQMHSMHSIVMVTLLSIPIKHYNLPVIP